MSRLIDADKLLDDMKKELEKAVNDENLDKDECMVILTSAIALKDFVNRQPTAFDVDKVARQLEKECVKHRINVAETNFCPPPRIINEYDYGISEGIMRAIEIVKAGEV